MKMQGYSPKGAPKPVKQSHRKTNGGKPAVKGTGNFSSKKGPVPMHHTHSSASKRTK